MHDNILLDYTQKNPAYSIKNFHKGGKSHQICKDGKIAIPIFLQLLLVKWYHMMLCHPGATRMENTIWQHFTSITLSNDIKNACNKFIFLKFNYQVQTPTGEGK